MRGARNTDRRSRRERPVVLGDEPALSVDSRDGPSNQRGVSPRWLAGTVLTGFASISLMGGALYASLDRQTRFARAIETGAPFPSDGADGPVAIAKKGDKMPVLLPLVARKHVVNLDTILRVGEREFVKVRPFARVVVGLALDRSELSPAPPPFDPLRIFASGRSADEPLARAVARPVEGEASLVFKDLDDSAPDLSATVEIPKEEIERMVRETAETGDQVRAATALMPVEQGSLFDIAEFAGKAFSSRDLEAFADLAVRGQAVNVSMIAKPPLPSVRQKKQSVLGPDDRIVEVAAGDTLEAILIANGSSQEEAAAIIAVMQERFPAEKLSPGLKIRMGLSPGEDDRTRVRPVRVSIYEGDDHRATVALSDSGVGYVAIDDPADLIADIPAEPEEPEEPNAGPRPTLHDSLYETAYKNDIPRSVIDTLVRVYSYDVDFQRRVKPGDSLEVFYAMDGTQGGEVFYTALTTGGETRRFYRYQSPEDGSVSFFDEAGKSARKFLMNKPLSGGVISSGFGMRKHPILGYAKMHTGQDYAAPRGTPIMAAGNGTIEKAGWESGYGKYVRIRHANGYETAYAHMSNIGAGIRPGVKVRQGQVIGYVGTTGRSTGNHLHYEVIVNGRFVNPKSLKVPRGQELQGVELAAFLHERDRIDWVTKRAPGMTHLAAR